MHRTYPRKPAPRITQADVPPDLGLLYLPAVLLLPHGVLTTVITDKTDLKTLETAFSGHRLVGIIPEFRYPHSLNFLAPKNGVGTVGRITRIHELPERECRITVTGICRFTLLTTFKRDGAFFGKIDVSAYSDDFYEPYVSNSNRENLETALRRYCKENNLQANWKALAGLSDAALITILPMALPLDVQERKKLLGASSLEERIYYLIEILNEAF